MRNAHAFAPQVELIFGERNAFPGVAAECGLFVPIRVIYGAQLRNQPASCSRLLRVILLIPTPISVSTGAPPKTSYYVNWREHDFCLDKRLLYVCGRRTMAAQYFLKLWSALILTPKWFRAGGRIFAGFAT
jgi:hypothetical protein